MRQKFERKIKSFLTREQESRFYCSENQSDKLNLDFGIPPLPQLAKIYYIASTMTHTLCCILNLVIILRIEEKLTGNNFIACYSPKLYVHVSIEQRYMQWFGFLISGLVLVWRNLANICIYELELSMFSYLLLDGLQEFECLNNTKVPEKMLSDILFIKYQDRRQFRSLIMQNRAIGSREKLNKSLEQCLFMVIFTISLFVAPVLYTSTQAVLCGDRDFYKHLFEGCDAYNVDKFYPLIILSTYYMSCVVMIEGAIACLLHPAIQRILIDDLLA